MEGKLAEQFDHTKTEIHAALPSSKTGKTGSLGPVFIKGNHRFSRGSWIIAVPRNMIDRRANTGHLEVRLNQFRVVIDHETAD